jgi:(4S)-4-hydroxy-5-phosphonooxypentane-2,3-dione isomerase
MDGQDYDRRMQILIVQAHVKPECIEAFKAATTKNAEASAREPGVARFDFLQQQDDPARFVLIEVYRTPEAPSAHKATAHYSTWAAETAEMYVEPRTRAWYSNVCPADAGW